MQTRYPGKGIDPQMIRDHGADVKALDQEIRKIELEALSQQATVAQMRSVPKAGGPRRWFRRRG
jgi:hypothetical protein